MIMQIALIKDPDARTTAPIRPSTINEKYSAGPNLNASSVRGGANAARTSVPTQPAKKDPKPAAARAGPPLPCLAIWWPSITVTTDEDSPGRLTRIAVVEPPYCDP
ncbi:hypothetical protein D3C87_1297120 [compost metagenome]